MIPQFLGQGQHFIDDVPVYFSLVLQHVAPLDPLLFLVLWYCTGLFPELGHTCFLCSGPNGVASLVPLMFLCIFSLLLLMTELPELDWEFSVLCSYTPRLDAPLEVGLSDLPTLEV